MESASPLDLVRLLRSGGGALLVQALLHGQLARVEWQEEKKRLLQMLLITLLGFACLLCALLFAGGFALAAAWETTWRLPALAGLVVLYAAGTAIAWRQFDLLAARGDQAFAASRAELTADAALLKSSL
jgi:uncharacterized membrane protein YqjE